tara:strand:+ start:1546 stop:2499 length:954 start_codon:yes stop_codon:yes gene_type:complete
MKLKTLKNITDKLRKYKKYEPPQPKNKDLPPTFNIILSSSPKGGGKSYNCIQLLTNYEESGFIDEKGNDIKMRIIWVSGGTSRSKQNSILDSLKYLHEEDRVDVEENIDEQMNDIYNEIKAERDTIVAYNIYREVYGKFMNKNLTLLKDDELMLLKHKNYIDPAFDPDVPRDANGNILYFPRMVFLILDDMISTDAFGSKKNNFFNRISVKSRHDSDDLCPVNLFFITQSFKAVPALIRRQTDLFVLLKSASRNYIIDAISEEIGSHFSKDEIQKYYDEIMDIPYGSLILSIHKKELEKNRIRMGWNNIIEREKKED